MTPPSPLARAIEATLFASTEPLTPEQIAIYASETDVALIRQTLNQIAEDYRGRGIELVRRGQRWHFQTAADLGHILRREQDVPKSLPRAATEVLAIIAYHEPVSRPEIEAIRGVQTAKGTLDILLEAGWIRVAGRREAPGRPLLYATTPEFLAHFDLASRKDLPGINEMRASGLLDPLESILSRERTGEAGVKTLE